VLLVITTVLLVSAADADSIHLPPTDPPPPPPPPHGRAVLAGRVTSATGVLEPLPYASVYLLRSRLGALSDERGSFRLVSLPAGLQTLCVRAIGYEPESLAVDLRDGETTAVLVRLVEHGVPRVLWSPPRAVLLRRLREATTVEVYRLDPRRWARDSHAGRCGVVMEHPVVARSRQAGVRWRGSLVALLADSSHWVRGARPVLGECLPLVAVRLRRGRDVTDLSLRLACGVVECAANDLPDWTGSCEAVREDLLRLFMEAFPRDAELEAIARGTAVRAVGDDGAPRGASRGAP
jgi:hypothetical protein